jgi:hypothetical protein
MAVIGKYQRRRSVVRDLEVSVSGPLLNRVILHRTATTVESLGKSCLLASGQQ